MSGIIYIQAQRNRSGRSGPGPTKNRRPCIIIITTTLASCLAATSAGGGASFLEAKCVNRIPVHCSCADVRISCSCKDGVQFSLSCCCSSYDAGTSVSSQPFFRFSFWEKKTRSCQAAYFKSWPWLTYDIHRDVVFCHLCVTSLHFNYCSSTLNS